MRARSGPRRWPATAPRTCRSRRRGVPRGPWPRGRRRRCRRRCRPIPGGSCLRQRHRAHPEVPAAEIQGVVPEAVAARRAARLDSRAECAVVEVERETGIPHAVDGIAEVGSVQARSLLAVRVESEVQAPARDAAFQVEVIGRPVDPLHEQAGVGRVVDPEAPPGDVRRVVDRQPGAAGRIRDRAAVEADVAGCRGSRRPAGHSRRPDEPRAPAEMHLGPAGQLLVEHRLTAEGNPAHVDLIARPDRRPRSPEGAGRVHADRPPRDKRRPMEPCHGSPSSPR